MSSYEQACALALALDRVGDRWVMLLVRELLIGPKRFSDLRRALPGMASNMLSSRLQAMQRDGLVTKESPLAGVDVYTLTPAGRSLTEAVHSLVRWGGQFVPAAPTGWLETPSWLMIALPAILQAAPDRRIGLTCNLEVQGFQMCVVWSRGAVDVLQGAATSADVSIEAGYRAILGLFSGHLSFGRLQAFGGKIEGSRDSVTQLKQLLAPPSP